MPQRTNDFQKLVKIINSRLAASGAKITESAMLYDPEAETKREVDVLIEASYLDGQIKIGIECNAGKNPIDIMKLEGFKEKHRKLNMNKTIIVSKNGFTGSAKKYAKKHNIKLLTFSAAKKEKWSTIYERFKGLSMYARTYIIKSISLNMAPNTLNPGFKMSHLVQVILPDGPISLSQFTTNIFRDSAISEKEFNKIKEHEENASDPWIEVGFNLDGRIEFVDPDDHSIRPQEIIVVYGYRSNYRDLNVGEISYDGKDLVAGGFLDKKSGENAYVAIAGNSNSIAATLELSGSLFPLVPENSPSKT